MRFEELALSRFVPATAALCLALCLSACGTSARRLDTAKVQRAIAKSILKEHGLHAKVTCPTAIAQKAGQRFKCMARFDAGVYSVRVTETDASGQVSYHSQQTLIGLDVAKVQRAITASVFSERHLEAKVSCPPEVLQRALVSFKCSAVVRGSGRTYPFVVSELDNAGRVRYVGT
jgi:hypothetical protein